MPLDKMLWNPLKLRTNNAQGLIATNAETASLEQGKGLEGAAFYLQKLRSFLSPNDVSNSYNSDKDLETSTLLTSMLNSVNQKQNDDLGSNTIRHSFTPDELKQLQDSSSELDVNEAPNTLPYMANKKAQPYIKMIRHASSTYGVPEDIIAAVIEVESRFNPNAKSHTGVEGLMQVTKETYKNLGFTGSRLNPTNSINAGTKLLSQLYKRYKNWEDALAAYNGGHHAVTGLRSSNWGTWKNNPAKQKEIQNYAKKVLSQLPTDYFKE